jgi:hypothetical protein
MGERLKSAKGGDLLFRFAHRCRGRQGLGNGLAIPLLGQLCLGTVAGIGRLGTMTIGLAAAAPDRGDRAGLEVAELENLSQQAAPEVQQVG